MGACKVKVCRICFAMDCQLHVLHENMHLYKGYEAVTGLMLADEEDLPPYLCTFCAEQLMNCTRFKQKSLKAHLMLLDMLKTQDQISVESIKAVIKTTHGDTDIEHTEGRMISSVKIEIDVDPSVIKLGDNIKMEYMSDDDAHGDAVPCKPNDVVKKEAFDEESVNDYHDSELGTGVDGFHDGVPSGLEKVERVGERKEAGILKDSGAKISNKSGSRPRKRGSTWDEDNLRRAMEAVQNNVLNPNAAALKFNIPKTTLRNHLASGNSTKGKTIVLTKQLEEELMQRIKGFEKQGIPITSKVIRQQAFLLCETLKIKHSFDVSTRMADREWLEMFLIRYPSILKRVLKNPAIDQNVLQHFEEVKKVYEELDILSHPERLYNMDERVLRVTVKDNEVLAKEGDKLGPEHADNVTITMCVNAVGTAIPPMIIFNEVKYRPEFVSKLPTGTIVNMAPKDNISHLLMKFLQHLTQYKTPGKCLLILNGAKCRLTYEALEKADKNNIVLYCLPSSTQELQPLDKLFRSFEHHWNEEMLHLYNSKDKSINVDVFDEIFSRIWPKCMNQANIMSGFKTSGLYPLDPDVISEDADTIPEDA